MKDFFQNILEKIQKEWYATLKNFGVKVKEPETMMTEQKTGYEVSLVPDVKRQMIKAMKFRNILLFICIVLVGIAGGTVVVMGSIWEGQNITMSGQDARLKGMSDKLKKYSSLSEFLTIQAQLQDLDEINTNKKVLSRVFSILTVLLPDETQTADRIEISELAVNLSENTLAFDAQADAKVSPYIDYRVLESFRKGVSLMKYDYGRYVTADGAEIPTRCLVETNSDGNVLYDEEQGTKYLYAYWMKGKKGCDPSREDEEDEETEVQESVQDLLNEFSITNNNANNSESTTVNDEEIAAAYEKMLESLDDYAKQLANQQVDEGVSMENVEVIKIYRSPRFSEWYQDGYIDESGMIDGVNHFESECITYTGSDSNGVMKWTTNNECMLASEEPVIRDSSNGRDSNDNLVLRFSATITLDPAIFKFVNKHVMAISPSGQNVTDSYRQIEGMFAERAADCADSDVICTTTSTGGNS